MLRRIIRKNKKKICLTLGIIFIVIIINNFFINKNYETTYKIDNIKVKESFDKDKNKYKFLFTKEELEYVVELEHKYIYKKELVDKIEVKEKNGIICIIPKSSKIDFYPLCYQDEELISYHLIEDKEFLGPSYYKKIKSKNDSYNKIEISNLNNKKYYIWNYKGFYVIEDKKNTTINIFDNDIYNIPLSYKINNSILIADYENKYKFNKFYLLQTKNNKLKEISTDKELSFESYIMGDYKKKVYFVDKKNKKQYEINTKKLSINDISKNNNGKILENNEWKEITLNKLSNKEYFFTTYQSYNYKIIDNKLYLIIDNNQIKVSNYNIKDIIEVDGETVYYLVDDKLYYYNSSDGEVLIMSYFEWNFNYKNMIYIF